MKGLVAARRRVRREEKALALLARHAQRGVHLVEVGVEAAEFFPVAARQYQFIISLLAVIGIVYGALMCLAQKDIKKLIAYSSVSHLGYCMLGMFAFTSEGASGSAEGTRIG